MNNKLKVLVSVTAMSFIMVGCGSSGGSSAESVDSLPALADGSLTSDRDHVSIIYNYSAEGCELTAAQLVNLGPINITSHIEYNYITCSTYGRIDGYEISEYDSPTNLTDAECDYIFGTTHYLNDACKRGTDIDREELAAYSAEVEYALSHGCETRDGSSDAEAGDITCVMEYDYAFLN